MESSTPTITQTPRKFFIPLVMKSYGNVLRAKAIYVFAPTAEMAVFMAYGIFANAHSIGVAFKKQTEAQNYACDMLRKVVGNR
jgi:hypothetical protein